MNAPGLVVFALLTLAAPILVSAAATGSAAADPGASFEDSVVRGQRPLPQGQMQRQLRNQRLHVLRISRQRPPCASFGEELPIVPNDPAALPGTAAGGRCLGTRAPALELWLPEDRYLWLDAAAPNPAVWLDLGPVELDARAVTAAPLGLMLSSGGEGGWILETRHGDGATLTPLAPGEWREVRSADGGRFWVQLGSATNPPAGSGSGDRPLGGGTVRFRAD